MQHCNLRPLQHYNELITRLGSWGRYQVRLLIIMIGYWVISGFSQAAFELTLAREFPSWLFFVEQALQIVVILGAVYFSVRFARTRMNFVLVILCLVGTIIVLVGVLISNDTVEQIGEIFVTILHYTMSLNIMMIMLEYIQTKHYPIVWGLSMLGFTAGKLVAVKVVSYKLTGLQWLLYVLVTCLLYYLLSLFFVDESPRFWIDQNIGKAQKLLNRISATNRLKYEPIEQMFQRQFFWHKVTLTKYSMLSLFSYKSISFNTYILGIQALLLGVICRCPDFIQHIRQGSSFQVDDSLEVIWVSIFQLMALVPTYLSSPIFKRKTALVATSAVLLFLTGFLAALQLGKFYLGNSILYSMTVFGLNSFFSMALFYFLVLSAFQFFPHTIRTISCGVIFCLYRLGRLLFSLHIDMIDIPLKRNEGMMELVLCCSFLLFIHSFLIIETFEQVGRYDLPEIEEKEYDDCLPA